MTRRKPIPRLTHQDVVERYVDYHFGRLPPEMNRAVETHIGSCKQCKREGLKRAAADRHAAVRKLRGVRGGKPLISPRGRVALLALILLLIAQLVIVSVIRGKAQPLLSVVSQWRAPGAPPALDGASVTLTARARLSGADTSGIALSVDGTFLAVAQGGEHPAVTIWNTRSRDRSVVFPWTDTEAPASMAWSPDGSLLAVASPSKMIIWSTQSRTVVWRFALPGAPATRVYDVAQQRVLAMPDPASLFSGGPVAWGADGALAPAPAGAAGPTGVTSPQTPIVGLWSSAGAHLYGDGQGAIHLGVSSADALRGDALIDWAPDGRYLLWASLDMPVTGGGASSASAPPDSLMQALVTRLLPTSKTASSPGANDALVWFSPDASHAAICDRGQPNTRPMIYAVPTGEALGALDITCAALTVRSAQWSAAGSTLYITTPSGSIAIYPMP